MNFCMCISDTEMFDIGWLLQFGAYPVFVLDGTPSPLKSQARIMRYFRSSGMDLSSLPEAEKGVSVERNRAFKKCIGECVVSWVLKLLWCADTDSHRYASWLSLLVMVFLNGWLSLILTHYVQIFLVSFSCCLRVLNAVKVIQGQKYFKCYYVTIFIEIEQSCLDLLNVPG